MMSTHAASRRPDCRLSRRQNRLERRQAALLLANAVLWAAALLASGSFLRESTWKSPLVSVLSIAFILSNSLLLVGCRRQLRG